MYKLDYSTLQMIFFLRVIPGGARVLALFRHENTPQHMQYSTNSVYLFMSTFRNKPPINKDAFNYGIHSSLFVDFEIVILDTGK